MAAVLVASDQVADVLAGRSVAAFADLAVDEALEIVGDRDVHHAHIVKANCSWQIFAKKRVSVAVDLRSGETRAATGSERHGPRVVGVVLASDTLAMGVIMASELPADHLCPGAYRRSSTRW